jgi:PEP-CTERM motif
MKTKIIVGLALVVLITCASDSKAATAPAPNESTISQQELNQSEQSMSVVLGIVKGMLGNKVGGYQLTPLSIPEPSTLALVGLGGSLVLLARRQRK